MMEIGWPPGETRPLPLPMTILPPSSYLRLSKWRILSRIYQLMLNTFRESKEEDAMDEDQMMEKKQAVLNTYQKILNFILGLEEQIKWMQRDHPSGLADIAELICPVCLISLCVISYSTSHQLVQAESKGHSDDTAGLCVVSINYIPPVRGVLRVKDVPVLIPSNDKSVCGFNYNATAHLLCPCSLYDKFDEDREQFCHKVNEGKINISYSDWPSFLYEEDIYNPDALNEGLLHGPLLVSVSCCYILCLSAADISIVLLAHIHQSMHCHEDGKGEIPRKKVCWWHLWNESCNTRDNHICCMHGEPPFHLVIYIFSNMFTSANLSLTWKTHGVCKMEPSMHPSSFRISWICLTTKNGARKRYLGGPSKWLSLNCMLYWLCIPDMYSRITPVQDMGRLPQIIIQVFQFWLGNALPDKLQLKKLLNKPQLKKLPNRLWLKKLPNKLPRLTHNHHHC